MITLICLEHSTVWNKKIRDLLDEVIPSPVIELSLEHLKSTHWRARYLMTESMLMQSLSFRPLRLRRLLGIAKTAAFGQQNRCARLMWSG